MTGSGGRRGGRSLLNRPQWGRSEIAKAETNTDIFSHGAHTYISEAGKREARRAEKEARKSLEQASAAEGSDEHREKRRRISISDDASEESSDSSDDSDDEPLVKIPEANGKSRATTKKPSKSASPGPVKLRQSIEALSPPHKPPSNPMPEPDGLEDTQAPQPVVIDIEDDEPDSGTEQPPGKSPTPPPEQPLPEDEFPELALRARELARECQRQRERASQTALSPRPSAPAVEEGSSTPQAFSDAGPASGASAPAPPAPAREASTIMISIVSRLPNARPLKVRRGIDQRLRDVRRAWCGHAGLPEDDWNDIVLVWRGIRVFDSSSCEALGLDVDEDGDITRGGRQEEGKDRQRVLMEAMTLELFKRLRKERESRRDKAAWEVEGAEEEEEAKPEPPKPEEKKGPSIRLVLRAKGLPEVKLILPCVSAPLTRVQWEVLTLNAAILHSSSGAGL